MRSLLYINRNNAVTKFVVTFYTVTTGTLCDFPLCIFTVGNAYCIGIKVANYDDCCCVGDDEEAGGSGPGRSQGHSKLRQFR